MCCRPLARSRKSPSACCRAAVHRALRGTVVRAAKSGSLVPAEFRYAGRSAERRRIQSPGRFGVGDEWDFVPVTVLPMRFKSATSLSGVDSPSGSHEARSTSSRSVAATCVSSTPSGTNDVAATFRRNTKLCAVGIPIRLRCFMPRIPVTTERKHDRAIGCDETCRGPTIGCLDWPATDCHRQKSRFSWQSQATDRKSPPGRYARA